jgi:hypothetical protein
MVDVSLRHKLCAGKGCENEGKIVLAIQYLKRTGHFCEACAEDLLRFGLVVGMQGDTNRNIRENDFAANGGKCKSRFYCIDCSKFTEDEVVRYDSNDHPVFHHNNGHKHHVISEVVIQFLLELGTSRLGQSTRYETAEMYGISVQQLDQILSNVVGDL